MTELAYTVTHLRADVPVADYLAACVDVPRFLAFCRACPSYATRWACPPFDFDPMALWRQYDTLALYGRVITPAVPGQAEKAALDALEREKADMLHRLLAAEAAQPGSLALSAGSCRLCSGCTRPRGLPCRQPDAVRHSIEALGGDVAKSAQHYLAHPLLWIQDGVLPRYLMLVGGLLTKHDKTREDESPT